MTNRQGDGPILYGGQRRGGSCRAYPYAVTTDPIFCWMPLSQIPATDGRSLRGKTPTEKAGRTVLSGIE